MHDALQAVEIIIVNGKFVPICWLQILRVCSNIIFAQHPSHFIYCLIYGLILCTAHLVLFVDDSIHSYQ